MTIGIPKEIKEQEHRIAIPPAGVAWLGKTHRVLVEKDAGSRIGFDDKEYAAAGAEIVPRHEDVFRRADLVVKVKEPLPAEYPLLRAGQLLFTYLHLAANRELTEVLSASGATAIAYECVEVGRRLPLLEPMSEVAGRMSVLAGGFYLAKHNGGGGVLLGGVPGVLPGHVTVIGGGTAGVNAARMASGLGSDVTILEVDLERMRFLDITMGASTLFSTETSLSELLPRTDLLIGAVLIPGAKAPKLVTRQMLRLMKPGSVFVDIAIDQGGCAETSRPTTHANPVYVEEGIVHYCVANMPGAYARTSTQALSNATLPYVERLANLGLDKLCVRYPEMARAVNVHGGAVTNRLVAEAHGMPWAEFDPAILSMV